MTQALTVPLTTCRSRRKTILLAYRIRYASAKIKVKKSVMADQDTKLLLAATGLLIRCDQQLLKVDSSCKKPLCICNSTFMALVIGNYFKTVLIWKIFNSNYDFLVPLCLYLVQKYEKNAVANDKWFFAT
jgi:hypothetical protein